MKRPRSMHMPRAFAMARRTAQSRPEAAAELVRLEYERDRIARDLAFLEQRRAAARAMLSRVDARARLIQRTLNAPDPSLAPKA